MTWELAFREHAAAEYPKECVGLVVDGEYRPCRNHTIERDMVNIHPEDWASAEDSGTVQALCHSHPDGEAWPSDLDLKMCNRMGIPWHILSWPDGELRTVNSVLPLLGREFVWGSQDCYSLCQDYYRQVWGIELPDFHHGEWEWWLHGKNLFLEGFQAAGFREIPKNDLRPGDAILMQIASPVPNHSAVVVEDGVILHQLYKRLSTREIYGGYFRKVSVRFLRHSRCSPKSGSTGTSGNGSERSTTLR